MNFRQKIHDLVFMNHPVWKYLAMRSCKSCCADLHISCGFYIQTPPTPSPKILLLNKIHCELFSRRMTPGFCSPGVLRQPLRKVLTSPKVFKKTACLSPYLFFSLGLLILEDQTELAQCFPSQVTKANLAESPPDISLVAVSVVFVYLSIPLFLYQSVLLPTLFQKQH